MRFDTIQLPAFLAPEGVATAIGESLARESGVGPAGAGAGLIAATDYCTAPHGLLRDHRVLFPDPVPIGREAILIRLERMIHAPRNPQVIKAVLKAASREETVVTVDLGNKSKRTERVPFITDLPKLAGQLASAQVTHPEFVRELLCGGLGSASRLLPDEGWPDLPVERAAKLFRDLAILWSLHDLQIVTARLHQSVYQPTGLFAKDEPAVAQVRTITASVKELRRALGVVRSAFARNHRPMNANEFGEWKWFVRFVQTHDLESLARTRANEVGLVVDLDGDYASCPSAMGKIRDLLVHLERNLGLPIGDGFEAAETAMIRTPTAIARWRHLRQKSRRLEKAKVAVETPPKKPLAMMSVTQLQHGMEPTTALAYAVILFVMRIDKIEEVVSRWREWRDTELPLDLDTSAPHAQGRTIDALLTTYRAAFLRDVGHLQDAADTPKPATEAVGLVHSAKDPLLPPTGKPLTMKDAAYGRGVSLEDKIPELDPFSYDRECGETSARNKRPGRPAIERARALIEQEPIKPLFDLSLEWRLKARV